MKKRKKADEKVQNEIDPPNGLTPNAKMATNLNILCLH